MDSKDLFNAIDKAAEEFVPDLLDSTDGVRPIVLHAEKKPLSLAKRIAAAAAACAAVVAVGAGVTIGVKNYSQHGSLISLISGSTASNIERNFAPAEEILRVRDMGFYSKGMSDDSRKILEEQYKYPADKESLELLGAVSSIRPPDVLYYNDLPLDCRMLSHEAYYWLWRYCLMSEEDRAGEIMPDEVKYLTGSGIIRFGDVGYLQDKYTEQELKHFKAYCDSPLLCSYFPPEPDVYYYDNVPYHTDQIGDEDAKNWLKWFCWLDEGTQAQLGGYVPRELSNHITIKCYPEPKFVNYKGKTIDLGSVSLDTKIFLEWYETLSAKLKEKVEYAPQELSEENLKNYPDMKLPVELTGPDGIKLTSADMSHVRRIINSDGKEIGWDEIGIGVSIYFDFVYLAEPGSNEFRRYNEGDKICGLTVNNADAVFEITDEKTDHAMQYIWGRAFFDGEISVDAVVKKTNGEAGYSCVATGLPIVYVDNEAQKQGQLIPKAHDIAEVMPDPDGVPSDYFGTLNGESDRLFENQGKILHDVKLENVAMYWSQGNDNMFGADLCGGAEISSAVAWKESGLRFPLDNVNETLMQPGYETSEMLDYLGHGLFWTDYECNVYSVDDGEVVEVCNNGYKYDKSYGKYVIIKHGEHKYAVYSHMSLEKDIPVKVGDKVTKGQVIGYAGTTGLVNRGVSGVSALEYHFYTDMPDY